MRVRCVVDAGFARMVHTPVHTSHNALYDMASDAVSLNDRSLGRLLCLRQRVRQFEFTRKR